MHTIRISRAQTKDSVQPTITLMKILNISEACDQEQCLRRLELVVYSCEQGVKLCLIELLILINNQV